MKTNTSSTLAGSQKSASELSAVFYGIKYDDVNKQLFITDTLNSQIKTYNLLTHEITVLCGNGTAGYYGDGGPALQAMLNMPLSVEYDPEDQLLYIQDTGNHRIRKLDLNAGIISTFAGSGTDTVSFVSANASTVSLAGACVAVLSKKHNQMFISSYLKVSVLYLDTMKTVTILNNDSVSSNYPDFTLGSPAGLAYDDTRAILYVSDSTKHIIIKYEFPTDNRTEHIISRIIGAPKQCGSKGDGESSLNARTCNPGILEFDSESNVLYFSDWGNRVVRAINLNTTIVTKVSSTCIPGFSGDGGLAINANTEIIWGISFDKKNKLLYMADILNINIRVVSHIQCYYGLYGAVPCKQCEPGTYTDTLGAKQCTPAPKGSFVAEFGANSSTQCSEGYYANGTGLTSCLPCEPGTYAEGTGNSECEQCPSGRFANTRASTSCTKCYLGFYAPTNGFIQCKYFCRYYRLYRVYTLCTRLLCQ